MLKRYIFLIIFSGTCQLSCMDYIAPIFMHQQHAQPVGAEVAGHSFLHGQKAKRPAKAGQSALFPHWKYESQLLLLLMSQPAPSAAQLINTLIKGARNGSDHHEQMLREIKYKVPFADKIFLAKGYHAEVENLPKVVQNHIVCVIKNSQHKKISVCLATLEKQMGDNARNNQKALSYY